MKRNYLTAITTIAALASATSAWSAVPVSITNAGFETDSLNDGDHLGVTVGIPAGWSGGFYNTDTDPSLTTWVPEALDYRGAFNPLTDFLGIAPEGNNVAWASAYIGYNMGLNQVLTDTLLPGLSYDLSIKIGNPDGINAGAATLDYRVEVLAGGTKIIEAEATSPATGFFTTVTPPTYVAPASGDPLIGQALEIRIMTVDDGATTGLEVHFDDITLTRSDLLVPIADAGGPYSVAIPTGSLSLDGSGSLPPDGQNITTYEWDLDNDGDFDEMITGATPASIPYATLIAAPPTGYGMVEGANTIKLRVTDDSGTPQTDVSEGTVTLAEPLSVSFTQVTNDADSGIDSADTYTHAIDFGNGTVATVNGVPFVNAFGTAAGGIPNTGTRTYGGPQTGNAPPAVSGNVAEVFQDFRYNGPDGAYVELTGLTPGQRYEFRLYDRAWDYNVVVRPVTLSFDVDSDSTVEFTAPTYDTNRPDDAPVSLSGNVSWVTSYTYVAGTNGSLKVSFGIGGGGTYHIYGLTNVEAGPDETAPAIDATNPADNSTGAYPGGDLVATFTEDIALTGAGTITITEVGGDGSSDVTIDLSSLPDPDATVDVSEAVLTIDPAVNLKFGQEYEVTIDGSAIEDLADTPNAYPGTAAGEWTFTPAAQNLLAPVIVPPTSPDHEDSEVVPGVSIVVTFDADVLADTGDITIVDLTDGTDSRTIAVTDTSQVTFAGNTMTVAPATNLQGARSYAVQIASTAVKNYSEVNFAGISGTTTWNFTVTDATTFTGPNKTNGDNWNVPGNWDVAIPSGALSAVILADKQVTSDGGSAGPYTGDLTIGTSAFLQIGWVNPRHQADFNALGTPGTSTIFMQDGCELRFRAGNNNGGSATVIPAITLQGDVNITLNTSTEPSEDFDFAHGINGPHTLTLKGKGNQDARLTAANSFNELIITSTEGSYDVFANATLSLDGDVTVEAYNGGPAADLTINANNAIADTATLALNGSTSSTLITMNFDDTVGFLTINGFPRLAGTYGASGSGATYEVPWISGTGILTVSGQNDPGSLTVDFAAVGEGGAPSVYETEPVTYTISLSGPHSPPLTVDDLLNTTGTGISIESFGPSSNPLLSDTAYEVVLMATEAGTLNLGIESGVVITDLFGNTLTVPVADNDTITVDPLPGFAGPAGIWKPWWNGRINPKTGEAWAEGDTYRIAFVSSTTRDATSPDIADYHAHVQAAADAVGWNLATFKCIGQSFNDTDGRANSGTQSSVTDQILFGDSTKLADDSDDLWNGPDHTFSITELGTSYGGAVATGSTRKFGDPGQTNIEHGVAWATDGRWWQQFNGSKGSQWHFYATSGTLTLQSTGAASDPYGDWATLKGVTGGFDDDDDGGGTSNGQEWYYFNSDPQVAEGLGSPLSGVTKTGANTFTFTHMRPLDRTRVSDPYMWSIDLVNWYASDASDGTNTVNIAAVGDATSPRENVTVTATVTAGTPTRLFLRQELSYETGASDPYADWATTNSVTLGFDGDDDDGGTSNGAEWYYFNSDPQVAEGEHLRVHPPASARSDGSVRSLHVVDRPR